MLYIYSPATARFGLRITMYEHSCTRFSMENFLISFRHMIFGCMLTLSKFLSNFLFANELHQFTSLTELYEDSNLFTFFCDHLL